MEEEVVVPWVEGRVVTTEMPLVAEEMIMMVPGTIVTAVMAAVEILVVMAGNFVSLGLFAPFCSL